MSLAELRRWASAAAERAERLADPLIGDRLAPAWYRLARPPRSRPAPDPARVASVLVWNVDSLGDSLWITPVLRALREGYPSASISLACNRGSREIFVANPNVDERIEMDAARFYRGAGLLRPVRELRGRRFDVMVILEMGSRPSDRARLLAREMDVGFVAASDLGQLKWIPDVVLPPNEGIYWPEHFMRITAALGIRAVPALPEVHCTKEDADEAERVLSGLFPQSSNTPMVVLHPCVARYAGLTKKWPESSFTELARLLSEGHGARIILTGTAEEAGECETLAARVRVARQNAKTTTEIRSIAGRLGARATVCLLKKARCVVTADTGLLHLSLAARAPTVALFGATDPRRIAPDDGSCVVLNAELPCRPCHTYRDSAPFWPTCIYPSPRCMESIAPETVAQEVGKILGADAS